MNIFILLWTILIFASIAWYGFLIIYIGIKGGRDIGRMTKSLRERGPDTKK